LVHKTPNEINPKANNPRAVQPARIKGRPKRATREGPAPEALLSGG
jgi:hypothetical protein